MQTKTLSWLKRSVLIPAALLGAIAFGGCKSASQLEEPSFLRQYSAPAKTAAAVPGKTEADSKAQDASTKDFPLKIYVSGKGTFAEDYAKGSGTAKAVASPAQNTRIPIYISGSYTESEQADGDTLTTRIIRGGVGIGQYHDLSKDTTGYAEGTIIAEGTRYENKRDNLDLEMARYFGVGKIGIIVRSLDLKAVLSGGFGNGTYEGTLGTADLDDIATRGFISLKGKMKLAGKGSIADFDSEDAESEGNSTENVKEKGVYALAGIGYDQQEFKNMVKGRVPFAELGLEWRDEIRGMPYFVRLLGTARQEEYTYPYAKDKKDRYFGIGADAGIKVVDCLYLLLGSGYDGEQHVYGYSGLQLSFGVKPKKK